MHLNVIIPCYNPPPGWEEALKKRFSGFVEYLAEAGLSIGLIVVNDGSSRGVSPTNWETLKMLIPGVQIINYSQNRGKGYALRQGVAISQADWHIITDADFPYSFESMKRILEALREQGGVAAGNRNPVYYDSVPGFRRWLSKALRWVLRNILRQPIDDSQCGLKGFDEAGKKIFLQTTIDRFLFDLEFLMLANGQVNITPVLAELRSGVTFSQIGWKTLATEGLNFLRLLWTTGIQKRKP